MSFSNTQIAFENQTNKQLRLSYWMFKLLNYNWLNNLGKKCLLICLKLRLPVEALIKKTIFAQFCGGESLTESLAVAKKLYIYKVGAILDYSIEAIDTENEMEKVKDIILQSIDLAIKNPAIPFVVFKVTGICSLDILEKKALNQSFSNQEKKAWQNFLCRFDNLILKAYEQNIPILIDAEESWIQNPIDELIWNYSLLYNTKTAIVYNTLQMYRCDRLDYLKKMTSLADTHKIYLGFKVVRGAYLEKEVKRALDYNYPSPINPTKDITDTHYNEALYFILNNLDKVHLFVGTHNEKSIEFLMNKMIEKNISKEDSQIWFSQLYGMGNHLSFNLAKKGYKVTKYLPFGKVREVIPYLFRRMTENSSIKKQSSRELDLITKEYKRRKIIAK